MNVTNLPAINIVVEGIANCLSDEIGHFFDELATRNPRFPGVLSNPRRNDLRSMCLVHRSWTPVVQRVLRRRVRIHSERSLKRFLKGPHCGPWVGELWYIHDKELTPRRKRRKGGKGRGKAKSHWELLAELLTRLPNLRFLSVELRDDPFPGDSDLDNNYEGESDSDEDEEQTRTASAQTSTSSEAEPEIEALKTSLAAHYEKAAAKEKIACGGIMACIRAIGGLSALEGLSVLADVFYTKMTEYSTFRHRRYVPYILPLCDELPKLTKLEHLHIRGWSGFYNIQNEFGIVIISDDDEGRSQEKELFTKLARKSPPSSLKNLIIEIHHHSPLCNYSGWLLEPKNDYALQNLFVVFDESCTIGHVINWTTSVEKNVPQLRNLRVEMSDRGFGEDDLGDLEQELRQMATSKFVGQQTRLDSLHVPPIFATVEVPNTVTDLRIILDTIPPERSSWSNNRIRKEAWERRDFTVRTLLEDSIPEFCEDLVELSITDKEDEYGELVCDRDIVRKLLPRTFRYADFPLDGIELKVVREEGFARRAADFLLYSRVQCSTQEDDGAESKDLGDAEVDSDLL